MKVTVKATVFIPVEGSEAHRRIAHGSGIVGAHMGTEVLLDYEGNLYGAVNMKTWADRVAHAWDRQRVLYPTIARMSVKRSDVILVGHFDGQRVQLKEGFEALVHRWVNTNDPAELEVSR